MTEKRLPAHDLAYWEARSQSHKDARNSLGTCPLMGKKVQLLPLRHGRVERLASTPDNALYATLKRPIGLRLLRDGYLYVIEENSGFIHEYRVEDGVPNKLLWQGSEVTQDTRDHATGEATLVFPRDSVLHVAFSEVQWTAAKCAKVIGSAPDRYYFMQRIELNSADCEKGGKYLRGEEHIKQYLAEASEQSASHCPTPDVPPEENQDYLWEHQPLFRQTHIGELKDTLHPQYEFNHLYLILEDSIGLMRDLAEEQDLVVGWINDWTQQHDNEMRYSVASYIDTLMTLNNKTATRTGNNADLFDKTTPDQRTQIYHYINARNHWRWENSKGLVMDQSNSLWKSLRGGQLVERQETVIARRAMEKQQASMIESLGAPLHDDLKDEIKGLEDSSKGTLQGVGLGARGIQDLIRVDDMQNYLQRERLHLNRWTERLDAITHDRLRLFTEGEFHRSAWYFDPAHPDQLQQALATEYNCIRDLCRTEEAVERVSDYFHANPVYILPVFYGRLDLDFLRVKAGYLIKLLDDARGYTGALADTEARLDNIRLVLGNHWTQSLHLPNNANSLHHAISATYITSIGLNMEKWLGQMHDKLNTPQLRAHLDTFSQQSNRAQRFGTLVALQQEGATLSIATAADVDKFGENLHRLNQLSEREDRLIRARNRAHKDANARHLLDAERNDARYKKQLLNEDLFDTRTERTALVREISDNVTPVSVYKPGAIGVRLNLTPEQQRLFDDEMKRIKAGFWKGYDTEGSRTAAFKSAWLPMLAVGLQLGNLGEAWEVWSAKLKNGEISFKQNLIFAGALVGVTSAAVSAYQTMHIAMIDKVLSEIIQDNNGSSGRLFAIRAGYLGLGLGFIIAPFALIGSVGTTWENWEKWHKALLHGSSGEKTGALAGLSGDLGVTAANTALTTRALVEGWGLLSDVTNAPIGGKRNALNTAWATRGSRFLRFGARLTPWGLAFTALQLGGEALYNYHNLDDQRRWMLGCYWGLESGDWDSIIHSQKLAEATLLPQIIEQHAKPDFGEYDSSRTLQIILPGLTLATFNDSSLRLYAVLQQLSIEQDVGESLIHGMSVLSDTPLTIALKIPSEWQGLNSQLQLRLAVKPALAADYLRSETGLLHYRIPFPPDAIGKKPFTASAVNPDKINTGKEIQITREMLHGPE